MLVRFGIICAAILTLAACDGPQSAPSASGTSTLARSASAGPGSKPVTSSTAVNYFTALCGQTDKSRANVETAAAANGFVQNTSTTTYYHQQNDLSVKLTDGVCSIVFVSKDNPSAVRSAFDSLSGSLGPVSFRDGGVIGGEHYYNARI